MLEDLKSADFYRLSGQDCDLGWILRSRAEKEPNKTFIRMGYETFSFAETFSLANNIARGLRKLGVSSDDYVAIMLPNCCEYILGWFGVILSNAAIVPINPQYRGFLLGSPLRDTKAKGLIIHRNLFDAIPTLEPDVLKQLNWIAVVGGTKDLAPLGNFNIFDFDELKIEGSENFENQVDYRKIHCVSYTSGTTGPSKGVMLSNKQFFSSACVFLRAVAMTHQDILFTPLPLFHGLASRLGVLPSLIVGAEVVISPRFSGTNFWKDATEAKATIAHTIFSIPPILKSQQPSPQDTAHCLRCMYNAHFDPEFEERFKVRLVEAYGMTETGLCVFTDYPNRRPGSAGIAHEDFEIQLVDNFDNAVDDGAPGEIVIRPKKPYLMMQGYIDKPEATVAAWRNLWFHTGDIAKRDEDGFFYFIDRVKDRIRRRGENISSWDIENFVNYHPSIAESVALPHPAPEGEDDIWLVGVVKPNEDLSPLELFNWLKKRMPKFMLPRYIEFLDELPRNPINKVEKYKLIQNGLSLNAWENNGK